MTEFPKRIADNIGQFTGRAWLLPELLDWWDGSEERVFLLTGDPGTGKSMVLAWLAGFGPEPEDPSARTQLTPIRKAVKAAHFCQAASRNNSPQAFAESIADQLASSVPGFAGALTATLADRVQITATQSIGRLATGGTATNLSIKLDIGALGGELSFDRAFTQPLKKLYASGYKEPMLLLIDALDEAQTYTGVTLVELLSQIDDLPARVRILATTRNEPRVMKFFHRIKPFDLIEDAAADVDDVRNYAEERLAGLTAIAKDTRSDFSIRLAKQAGSVFLYAAMVLDELIERPPAEFLNLVTYPLPDSLSGLYRDFLNRELGKDDQRWFDLYEPLLGVIAVAQGEGLTSQQLTDIIGKDIRAALRASKQYLSGDLPDGPFRPFHKSFADFLLEDEDNFDYHIDSPTMHGRIADQLLLMYDGRWGEYLDKDNYALRYVPYHLYEAAQAAGIERDKLTRSLVRVTGDPQYQRRFERHIGDIPALKAHVHRAIQVAAQNERDDMLPWLIKATQCYVAFHRDYLQAETVLKLAEEGNLEQAEARLRLFTGVDEDWRVAARLIIAWLGSERNLQAAKKLRARMPESSTTAEPLRWLSDRLAADLGYQSTFVVTPGQALSLDVAQQLVKRVSGQVFDRELLLSINPRLIAIGQLGPQLEMLAKGGYAAEFDAPILVNVARGYGKDGTELVDRYIDAHSGYNYVEYRNRSLWFVLSAVLSLHPEREWVKQRLRKILTVALSGGGVDYCEMLPLTALVLYEGIVDADARRALDHWRSIALSAADRLQDRRGADDSWGNHKHRLTALLELYALLAHDRPSAEALLNRIRNLPGGFAGFQAPAYLRLADALRACGMNGPGLRDGMIEDALRAAHNIQDYHFCARVTARCNAMKHWHNAVLTSEEVAEAIRRLASSPANTEFAADHVVHEEYRYRAEDSPDGLPIDIAGQAETLEQLVEVFQRPAAEFRRLNPQYGLTQTLDDQTPVRVPDPGFPPLLAVHLAARTLADDSLDDERGGLFRMLVPVAASNPTALDTLLSYLLIASGPHAPEVLEDIEREAGPVVFSDVAPSAE